MFLVPLGGDLGQRITPGQPVTLAVLTAVLLASLGVVVGAVLAVVVAVRRR